MAPLITAETWLGAASRIGVLLNRYQKGDPTPDEVSRLLDRPVVKAFPNEYAEVKSAVASGLPVPANSRLGRAYDDFAAQLVSGDVAKAPTFAGKLRGLFSRG